MDYLAHYGIPGMRWGVRRAQKTISSAAESFRKNARKNRDKANWAGAYVALRTDSKGQVHGSLNKELNVSRARMRNEKFRDKQRRSENVAKGIEKAKTLVNGMDMKQSIKTLQKAAGYSKADKFMSHLLSRKNQLWFASVDYALRKTRGGKKQI